MTNQIQIYQAPLAECDYFPEEILFVLDEAIEVIAERLGFDVESHWVDGLGPADGIFLMSNIDTSCILFRYRYGGQPDKTVVGCAEKSRYSPAVIEQWMEVLVKKDERN